ncbi:hypothetical protein Mboo_2398 [Methanoregula boonei 6A8]|uniref:Uncharacterized protein n=1 Tax=Methanoregula boonei (strain DSM 21154 / JCM 14090 / 6A8) TaxID=456442 RepID=A7IB01_METB6|nr:hypothetical protein [Methanoregula boonei]ABS56912.1 hypothetical protein Mboo_2398 [Methanoregula boonei 6A8]
MQTQSHEMTVQDQGSREPAALVARTMDTLALTWSIGIGIGYLFLISLICWIGYRCFLVYHAGISGDYPFITAELGTDLLIVAAYFGIALVLRKMGYI